MIRRPTRDTRRPSATDASLYVNTVTSGVSGRMAMVTVTGSASSGGATTSCRRSWAKLSAPPPTHTNAWDVDVIPATSFGLRDTLDTPMPNRYPAVANGPPQCPALRSTVTVQLHARDTDSPENVVDEKPHVVRYLLGKRDTNSDLADDVDDSICGMIESLPLTPSSITLTIQQTISRNWKHDQMHPMRILNWINNRNRFSKTNKHPRHVYQIKWTADQHDVPRNHDSSLSIRFLNCSVPDNSCSFDDLSFMIDSNRLRRKPTLHHGSNVYLIINNSANTRHTLSLIYVTPILKNFSTLIK